MPVMDGVTATRLLREGGIALPVVGVTGNALEEDIRSFMKGGATEILVSPVALHGPDRAAFVSSLRRLFHLTHVSLSLILFFCACV